MRGPDETILVTGATGFIGGRVCERLVLAKAARVRALVHTPHRAARIARLPIELCAGSLLDASSLRAALGDAKIVVHCGLGNARGIVKGTENLLAVAAAAGVKRFIHMSTAAVYGLTPPPGCETEDAPVRPTGDGYCDNKGRAERMVLRFGRRGLPVVILRPSIVYGPYASWSTRLIDDLRHRRVVLIDGGRGACNTTYVDNLIDAIFLSFTSDQALGECLFITDGETITWGDFIRAHVRMLGEDIALPEISRDDVLAHYKRKPGLWRGSVRATAGVLRSREFRQLLLQIPASERVLSKAWQWLESLNEQQRESVRSRIGVRRPASEPLKNGLRFPDEVTFATQAGTVFFRIDKARELLGYKPRVTFAQGMNLVEQWLRHAAYLDDVPATQSCPSG